MQFLRMPSATHESRSYFNAALTSNYCKVDHAFAVLLILQWVICIGLALVVSPRAWEGTQSMVHSHVLFALVLGGLIVALPLYLIINRPGELSTRLVVASSQVLFSALFIHLTAGRIETHFHAFVSLALLVAYRDQLVFLPAVIITVIDHFVRGVWWPISVFGAEDLNLYRPIEHAVWLGLEAVGLLFIVNENLRQWMNNAILQSNLQQERDLLELRVAERTRDLEQAWQSKTAILNSVDASIGILDASGCLVFANKKWQEQNSLISSGLTCRVGSTERPNEELCEVDICAANRFWDDITSAVQNISEKRIESSLIEVTDGDPRFPKHYQIRLSPVTYRDAACTAVIQIDVTQMKLAEQRVRDFTSLVLESPDQVYVATYPDLQIIEVNASACRNSCLTRSELLSRSLDDVLNVHELIAAHQEAILKESNVIQRSGMAYRNDGTQYPCQVSLHRGTFAGQSVWFAYLTDLSEQRQLETQLQQAQRLEALGHLAAGIAHEMNTPMQCVFGNVEFIQKSFETITAFSDYLVGLLTRSDVDLEQEKKAIEQLRASLRYDFVRAQTPNAIEETVEGSRRVSTIVRAMKFMSHPGTNDKVQIDLHEVIRSASTVTRNRWKEVAQMKFDFCENLPVMYGYPAELSQVFMNLFVNSTDAIAEKIGQHPAKGGEICVETLYCDQSVVIQIHDNGVGIPKRNIDKIFNPFFTTKGVGKGTGQGLSIAYGIVVGKHNGTIKVVSQQGLGTTFIVTLPVKSSVPKIMTDEACDRTTRLPLVPMLSN